MKLNDQKCCNCDGIFPPHDVICKYCYERIGKHAYLATKNNQGREDNYMLHGVLARLQAAETEWHKGSIDNGHNVYMTVIEELINTLQAYLSQE